MVARSASIWSGESGRASNCTSAISPASCGPAPVTRRADPAGRGLSAVHGPRRCGPSCTGSRCCSICRAICEPDNEAAQPLWTPCWTPYWRGTSSITGSARLGHGPDRRARRVSAYAPNVRRSVQLKGHQLPGASSRWGSRGRPLRQDAGQQPPSRAPCGRRHATGLRLTLDRGPLSPRRLAVGRPRRSGVRRVVHVRVYRVVRSEVNAAAGGTDHRRPLAGCVSRTPPGHGDTSSQRGAPARPGQREDLTGHKRPPPHPHSPQSIPPATSCGRPRRTIPWCPAAPRRAGGSRQQGANRHRAAQREPAQC